MSRAGFSKWALMNKLNTDLSLNHRLPHRSKAVRSHVYGPPPRAHAVVSGDGSGALGVDLSAGDSVRLYSIGETGGADLQRFMMPDDNETNAWLSMLHFPVFAEAQTSIAA